MLFRSIAAIHRGFSTFEKTRYRNVPKWQIPIELKRRFPGLPVICDPSHICGTRALIGSVAQTALDLNYDGLMVESHAHPEKALSDAEQQLSPAGLAEMLSGLIVRSAVAEDVIFLNRLEELRDRIDTLDEEILQKISDRMDIAREIGRYKKENNITILQVERWNEILRTRLKFGMDHDLTREFIQKMYELVHDESILQQTSMMNNDVRENKNSPVGTPGKNEPL